MQYNGIVYKMQFFRHFLDLKRKENNYPCLSEDTLDLKNCKEQRNPNPIGYESFIGT